MTKIERFSFGILNIIIFELFSPLRRLCCATFFFTSLFSISYLSAHSQQTAAAAAHISARFEWIAIKCKKTAAYDENLNMKKFFVSILSQSCDDNEIYVLYSAGIAVVYMHKVAD